MTATSNRYADTAEHLRSLAAWLDDGADAHNAAARVAVDFYALAAELEAQAQIAREFARCYVRPRFGRIPIR